MKHVKIANPGSAFCGMIGVVKSVDKRLPMPYLVEIRTEYGVRYVSFSLWELEPHTEEKPCEL